MALPPGTRLGAYEIAALIGAGGMGEVYRARDTRLNRDVALKVLPELFAADPDRLARFKREAQLLASLNHPNIAAIYGFEESALAMELVDGPTLADRIAQGPIQLDEALPIARQIAEALETAHERGVIHRDLKPANIKVRPDGTVKVLDFGLAKVFEPDVGSGFRSDTLSPTIPSPAATRLGVILGTAAYMSPEQARGKAVDKRTDIWAFGCVLYEMLTGRRPFDGDEVTDVLARVLERQIDFSALPTKTPAAVARLLRRCLEKDPKRRTRDIGDARLELDAALSGGIDAAPAAFQPNRGALTIPASWAWLAAAIVVALIAASTILWLRRVSAEPEVVSRFALPVPTGFQMTFGQIPSLAISPDGTKIVYHAEGRLYLRALNRFEAEPIPGTEGGIVPFFSPDGAWLGFLTGTALMKVPIAGGPPIKVADAFLANGAAWGTDGRIVVGSTDGLQAVSGDGGTLTQITVVSESANESMHAWPDALPDGSVLYTVLGASLHANDARLVIEHPATGARTVVAEGVSYGRYVSPGHLLYADVNGTLLIQPYDLAARRPAGSARAVLSGVRTSNVVAGVAYAASSTGTLVYATGTELTESLLVQLDLSGRELRRFGAPRSMGYPALSPDGRTLALMIRSSNNDDLYLMDVASGRFDRFSFDGAEDESPVWSPDGRRIAYSSASVGQQRRIFVKTVGAAEPERLLYTGKNHLHVTSWSPDGAWLGFSELNPRSVDAWVLNVNDPTKLLPVANTSAGEADPMFSPDGRWLAYSSDETGRGETYVVSFPDMSAKQQVSREGGFGPRWSATGRELFFFDRFYLLRGRMMMARRTDESRALAWEDPKPLFEMPRVADFTPARDGRSMYFIAPNPDGPAREINVVVNWLQETLAGTGALND